MITAQAARDLLQRLIRIPSVNPREGSSPGEQAVAEFTADWLRNAGLRVEMEEVLPGRPNVIATLPGRDPFRFLLLESHLDTVETDGMRIAPFAGEVRDGRIYGRGACDAKGPLAAFMLALAELAERGVVPPVSITLAAVIDEEHQYRGVSHLLQSGRQFTAAIVGEPTGLDLVVAHKGSVRFTVATVGQAAHSSAPEEGDNAIERMADVLGFIRTALIPELKEHVHALVGSATLCVSMIRGGTAVNVVPESCTIDVDRRTIPGEDPLAIWRVYKNRLEAFMPGHVQVGEPFILDFALEPSADCAVVKLLREEARQENREPAVIGVNYGTDGSKIARYGVPTVVFGPGSIHQAHSADEFLELDQLVNAAQILANVLQKFKG